jgi:hypothetical protein
MHSSIFGLTENQLCGLVVFLLVGVLLMKLTRSECKSSEKYTDTYREDDAYLRQKCVNSEAPRVDFALRDETTPYGSPPSSYDHPVESGNVDFFEERRKLDAGETYNQYRGDWNGASVV